LDVSFPGYALEGFKPGAWSDRQWPKGPPIQITDFCQFETFPFVIRLTL
jgi:hypothetical protein